LACIPLQAEGKPDEITAKLGEQSGGIIGASACVGICCDREEPREQVRAVTPPILNKRWLCSRNRGYPGQKTQWKIAGRELEAVFTRGEH
jgi:hypothetical protein